MKQGDIVLIPNFKESFITEKQYRKLKLKKLSQ